MSPKEKFQSAKKSLQVAEHMLTQTYPALGDSKVLLAVLSHIHQCYTAGLQAALLAKQSLEPGASFKLILNHFRVKCAREFDVDVPMLTHMEVIQELVQAHKESPVEFARKDKFVICDEEYTTKVLSPKGLKEQIVHAKVFIEKIASKLIYVT